MEKEDYQILLSLIIAGVFVATLIGAMEVWTKSIEHSTFLKSQQAVLDCRVKAAGSRSDLEYVCGAAPSIKAPGGN
jgi:hypothetical protein